MDVELLARMYKCTTKFNITTCYKTMVGKCNLFQPKVVKYFYTPCGGITKPVINMEDCTECDNAQCTKCLDSHSGKRLQFHSRTMIKQPSSFFLLSFDHAMASIFAAIPLPFSSTGSFHFSFRCTK